MIIFFKNILYRRFLYSSILGYSGRTLFDIAFIIYATSLPNPELAVGIASIATTFPYMISFVLGYFADRSKDKLSAIIRTRYHQFILFLMFAFITIYDTSWYVFIGIVMINVIADILGGYNSYLSMSITTKLVDEDLSTALAFQNSIYNIISLGAKTVGVFILGLVSYNYSYFGLINAMLFLLALIIIYYNKNIFSSKIGIFNEEVQFNKISFSNFIIDTRENLRILKTIKMIYKYILLFCGMNFYSGAMHTLFLMLLIKSNVYIFENMGYTIVLLETLEIVSMIVAGFFPIKFYKTMSLKFNMLIEIILFIFYTLNLLYFESKVILLILTILIGYFAGISNPKLDSLILKSVPEDKQTSIFSIFGTLITITVPISTVTIVGIANFISIVFALKILLILLLVLLIYLMRIEQRKN